jgi:hypothetical protein
MVDQVARAATPSENAFVGKVADFLNGRAEDLPELKTRSDIARAERLLLEGSFSGHPDLQDELREEIKSARDSQSLKRT